jgi:hypothetical protein
MSAPEARQFLASAALTHRGAQAIRECGYEERLGMRTRQDDRSACLLADLVAGRLHYVSTHRP